MEDWKVLYASKLMTADEAVRQIPDGSRVFFGHAANEPPVLVDALVRNYEQYKDVEIVHWVPMGKGEYCDPKMKGHLRHNAMFVGGPTRKAVQEGRADYTPFFFHQSTRFFSDGTFPIDVAMVSVTPPDKHGYVSLGVSVGGTKPACLNAKMVIAQVNDQMPRTMGESFLHVSQLTCCVEASTPLPELGGGTIGEVEEAIGRNVASLVEDGSTLQLGIGTIPDAVLKFLGDKKDLGIHSEMFSDGVVDLYQKGVITGANKRLDKGKMVAAFLMGSKKLYDFVDDNPDVMMRTVDYVNNRRDLPESQSGVHQLLPTGGLQRSGELRVHGHQAILRHRRSAGLCPRRGHVSRRQSHSGHALHGQARGSVPDRPGV